MYKPVLLFVLFLFLFQRLDAQLMNHYWIHNFNSTSSLLGGAVVAGDGSNTAIYYNPATVQEMEKGSNFSLAANLFTWNFYTFRNGLGEGINMKSDNFLVQPQFISYTYRPPKLNGISVALAVLTRVKERLLMNYSDSYTAEIIERYPGPEQYNTVFTYRNEYSDSWVGAALAHSVNEKFSYGASMFVSFSYLDYNFGYSATAFNSNNINISNFRLSESTYSEFLHFVDYRLIFKVGAALKHNNWRFGFNLTTPSWRLFSSGKRAQRTEKRTNIAYNDIMLPDYIIFDGQSKGELSTNYRLPLSVSFGFIHKWIKKSRQLYFSMEYFERLKGYKMVDAQINTDITTPFIYELMENKDWLSFAYASNPLFNVAIGFSQELKENLVFLNAVRTDFSSNNPLNLDDYEGYNSINTASYNIYHYSAGLEFAIRKSRFIAGGNFSFGYKLNQPLVANFSNPQEFDPVSGRSLQGPIENIMDIYYFGFSIYLGATLNFIREEKPTGK